MGISITENLDVSAIVGNLDVSKFIEKFEGLNGWIF